jgi:hypothetical protein
LCPSAKHVAICKLLLIICKSYIMMCCTIEFYETNIRRSEDTRYAQINNELLTLTKSYLAIHPGRRTYILHC